MILQPASRKEVRRIALGTGFFDLVLIAGLFVASLLGIGKFELVKILLSTLAGSAIGILSFTIMCLTIQSAVTMTDKKKMKAKFQLSYNIRMVLQAGWAVAAFLIPGIHFIAAAAPILFPKVTIIALQATGRLMPKEESTPAPVDPEQAETPADQ